MCAWWHLLIRQSTLITAGSSSTPTLMDSGKRCWVIATYGEHTRGERHVDKQAGGSATAVKNMENRGRERARKSKIMQRNSERDLSSRGFHVKKDLASRKPMKSRTAEKTGRNRYTQTIRGRGNENSLSYSLALLRVVKAPLAYLIRCGVLPDLVPVELLRKRRGFPPGVPADELHASPAPVAAVRGCCPINGGCCCCC